MLSSVVERLSEKYPRRILIENDSIQDIDTYWDPNSISMVLYNLIANSLEIADDTIVKIEVEKRVGRRWKKRIRDRS